MGCNTVVLLYRGNLIPGAFCLQAFRPDTILSKRVILTLFYLFFCCCFFFQENSTSAVI